MAQVSDDGWVQMLGADPRPWLLAADEASARWIALTALLDRPDEDPDARAARSAALSGPMVGHLIARLPRWGEAGAVSGHHSPAYMPNLLHLLADLGVKGGDDDRIEPTGVIGGVASLLPPVAC